MENIIVILIVAIAAGYIGRGFYHKYVKKKSIMQLRVLVLSHGCLGL